MSNTQCPIPGGRSRCFFPLSLLSCVILAFVCGASGQSQDQVHIEPRKDPAATESSPSSDQPRLKSMRIDTNLVLIPVTVSDTLNRPVTSLGKQNFELFEGGEQQKIRYFSTEDAPISIGVL